MRRLWPEDDVISAVVSVTNVEIALFEDEPMQNISELLIEVEDAGATTCTLILYGSFDSTTYTALYTFLGSANLYDGTAAAATQTSSLSAPVLIYTDKVFPYMKLTANRASAGAANVTVKVKTSRG
ncbi:MAG: hypothetical protein HXS54_06360 [Theionarchaea archaeon]|nr:hypothetical protein [Theionarchaea archaeon]DBA34883.1 TPA_asm: hypothetical protein vir521_00089 [Caudoviricetes sp. vir521]